MSFTTRGYVTASSDDERTRKWMVKNRQKELHHVDAPFCRSLAASTLGLEGEMSGGPSPRRIKVIDGPLALPK